LSGDAPRHIQQLWLFGGVGAAWLGHLEPWRQPRGSGWHRRCVGVLPHGS